MRGGVLVVDKPAGPTSFDVVQRVRRALRVSKAGHAGTLDPAATGVLAVCLDDAVKLQAWLADADKAYEAEVAFGAATSTEDAEGEVVERGDASRLTAEEVRAALPALTGEITQVPPMYSAVRVGGRRLHEAARAGETVDRTPRKVRVDSLELLSFDAAGPDGLARARVAVRCGKGTYVRTLAADLGRKLGVPAHLAALRRTMASGFDVGIALPLAEVEALATRDRSALEARIVSPAEALGFMAEVPVDAAETIAINQGKQLRRAAPGEGFFRAVDAGGRLVAILVPCEGGVRPVRVFPPEPPDVTRPVR